jgi:hypothetical protein
MDASHTIVSMMSIEGCREGTVMIGARYRAVNLLCITCHAVCQNAVMVGWQQTVGGFFGSPDKTLRTPRLMLSELRSVMHSPVP